MCSWRVGVRMCPSCARFDHGGQPESFASSQELMRSFNRDRRIFCAILSTHSRATGVSLVEADAVVFYDNDLNPVMDAKAQEWCERIGRRKDVHIYR